jgi:CubicO group peptidase (beta-lactamase class C family)
MKLPNSTSPLVRLEFLAAIVLCAPSVLAQEVPGTEGLDEELPEVVVVRPSEELEELHHELYERAYDGSIGCLSVLAVVDGEVVWEQGFGWADRAKGHPASSSTIYPIASVSKGLVGLAASLLVTEGELDWKQPVSDVLDSFEVHTGSWVETELLVRDLAQMTAGIPHGGMDWLRDAPTTAHEGSLSATAHFAVVDEDPGREFRYSNYTSGVLEAVVHDVSGEPLDGLLQRRVFAPLGMTTTSALRDAGDSRLVRVHSGTYDFDVPPFSTPSGGLGFYSSAKDLGRLAALHLDPSLCDEIGVPRDAVTFSRAPRDGRTVGPGGYWMGWGHIEDGARRFYICNGQIYDATSCLILCPERGTAAICLTDTQWDSRPGGTRLADAVATRIMDALVGGCGDAFQAAEQEYALRERLENERRAAGESVRAEGGWTGTLTLAGKELAAELQIREPSSATLTFGSVSATSHGLRQIGGHLEGEFRCRGELDFFGETSELSSLSIRVTLLETEHLVGSAILGVGSSERKVSGSGAALLRFSRVSK